MLFWFFALLVSTIHHAGAEVPWEEVAPDEPGTLPGEYKICQNHHRSPLPEQSTDFQDELRRRAVTLIENKIDLTGTMQACFGAPPGRREDVPLFCRGSMSPKLFSAFIKPRWREMRVQLALSLMVPASPTEEKASPHMPPLHHAIADFPSMPELDEGEKQEALEQWKERVADKLSFPVSPDIPYIKNKIARSAPYRQLKKEARIRYFEILESMPLLGYIQSPEASQEEIAAGLETILNHLKTFLTRIRDPEEKTLPLSFRPLVEELLREHPQYCPSAEALSRKARNMQKMKTGMLLGGALAFIPFCLATGPIGLSICLAGGLGVGWAGLEQARDELTLIQGRALTGREFEKLSQWNKK